MENIAEELAKIQQQQQKLEDSIRKTISEYLPTESDINEILYPSTFDIIEYPNWTFYITEYTEELTQYWLKGTNKEQVISLQLFPSND